MLLNKVTLRPFAGWGMNNTILEHMFAGWDLYDTALAQHIKYLVTNNEYHLLLIAGDLDRDLPVRVENKLENSLIRSR